MNKLFIIDAYAMIYRSYYGFIKNPITNSKGQNTSAIFGFVNSIQDIIKRENPTHIAVAFDPHGPTFRHLEYKEYKAQREETPDDIKKAIPIIKDIVNAYNIPIFEIKGYEADDVIGTLSNLLSSDQTDVYMVTPDKDYAQLVKDHVFMYKPKFGSSLYTTMKTQDVLTKYDISNTKQIIDYLGLVGDSADNIPGCPGVGKVTAAKLLKQFGSTENLLENTDQLKGALKKKIEENVDKIKMSKYLATIITDIPIETKIEDLKISEPNIDDLTKIYTDLEFKNHLVKLQKKYSESQNENFDIEKDSNNDNIANKNSKQQSLWDQIDDSKPDYNEIFEDSNTNDEKKSILTSLKETKYNYHLIENEEDIKKLVAKMSVEKEITLDTETTNIEPMKAKIIGISFCWKKNEAFYISLTGNKENKKNILENLKTVLENPRIKKIGQNIKYDIIILKNYGIDIKGEIFDTMIAHYLLEPELKHNMDYMAEIYLNYKTIAIEELIGSKGKSQKNMSDLDPKDVYEYACEDSDITFQLKEYFEKQLIKHDLKKLSDNIEMPLVKVLAKMEFNGVSLDFAALKDLSIELTTKLDEIEKEIINLAGEEFNVNSPKQTGVILFEKLKISEKAKKTKSGQFSTSEAVLTKYEHSHPIVKLILEQRGLKKLLSTYIDALPKLINEDTGKIHTSFNQAVTVTGRLSSSNPNLQNIPIRQEMGKKIRQVFSAGKDEYFLSADYSQIELRIMAHLSKDKNMIEAFKNGKDIHADTASKIFKVDIKDVDKEMRRKAKTANFGIIYGISVFGLAQRMDVKRGEAKELIDNYFITYKDVKKYMDNSIAIAKEKGYVSTEFSRKRHLPDINSHNSIVRGYAERNAINAPIQGTAADIIKIAMINIDKEMEKQNLKSKMIIQVHDELNFIVPKDEIDIMKKIVTDKMENAVKLEVPLTADVQYGENWLDAHS